MSTITVEKLTIARTLNASRERVFEAWTKADQFLQWFGSDTCKILDAKVDPRQGGKYYIRTKSESCGEKKVSGEYREVTTPSKLVFTWGWDEDSDYAGVETLVTVEFIAKGESSTEVRLTHEHLPSEESRAGHSEGWNACLTKLEKHLSR